MKVSQILFSAVVIGAGALIGCANDEHRHASTSASTSGEVKAKKPAEEIEPGEVKVTLEQTPAAARKTIERELKGNELEDIARKQQHGKTVYETDIIKPGGEKWEVVVAENGDIVSKLKEGGEEEQAADKEEAASKKAGDGWRDKFDVEKQDLAATGNNSFLPIQPGKVWKLSDGKDTLTVTILAETKTIDGVKCGVLEERETKDGELAEISRNFFATDKSTNDVYYLGEDVDNFKDGKLVDHESEWHAGEKGARMGLMLPGKPKVGEKFYQEIAPKVAMDRVEVVSTDETVKTPAGTFEHCLHLKETTPLESDVSHKYYAPGVGMIKDDAFELAEKP
jgi:hypothetical protein